MLEAVSKMSALHQAGINLLAIDFDLTLIDVHTGGCWAGSAATLAARVRPCMKQLMDEALSFGTHVAVVTFSPQVRWKIYCLAYFEFR